MTSSYASWNESLVPGYNIVWNILYRDDSLSCYICQTVPDNVMINRKVVKSSWILRLTIFVKPPSHQIEFNQQEVTFNQGCQVINNLINTLPFPLSYIWNLHHTSLNSINKKLLANNVVRDNLIERIQFLLLSLWNSIIPDWIQSTRSYLHLMKTEGQI